jgi:hypothetical protein
MAGMELGIYITVQVELDLIVLETQHDTDCDMFRSGSLECNCTSSFRYTVRQKICETYVMLKRSR